MEDLAGIHKRPFFLGFEIRAVHEGVVNTVLVGLRGLVGQLHGEDNAHKVRRGLAGRVKQGLAAGGLRNSVGSSTRPTARTRAGGPPFANFRNTSSPHWLGWLKPKNRCLAPFKASL